MRYYPNYQEDIRSAANKIAIAVINGKYKLHDIDYSTRDELNEEEAIEAAAFIIMKYRENPRIKTTPNGYKVNRYIERFF